MLDLHYTHPVLAHIYDANNSWGRDNDLLLDLAPRTPGHILDVGCGTGMLSVAFAKAGHIVTGIDPAQSMIEVARNRPGGEQATWIVSDARSFRTDERFDLIVMTGHVFQVFLSDDDVLQVLLMMERHLAPHGTLIFETRNPKIDWVRRWDGRTADYDSSYGRVREEFKVIDAKEHFITFETHYYLTEETLVSRSTLRFLPLPELRQRLDEAGLRIKYCYGDWDKTPFHEESDEIIIVAQQTSLLTSDEQEEHLLSLP